MDFKESVYQLTLRHPFLTFQEASSLLVDAHVRFKPQKRYGGLYEGLMSIEYGKFLYATEEQIKQRLAAIAARI